MLIEYGPLIELFLNAIIAGIMTGAIFGLMCAGVGLIYGVMGVVNFAQGEFMMLGMFFTYFVTESLLGGALGPIAGPFAAALLAGPVIFGLGWLTHLALLRPVTGVRGASVEAAGHYAQLILTLGLSLIVANGGLIIFGSSPASVRTPLTSTAFQFEPFGSDADVMLFINQNRLLVTVLAMLIAAGLWLFVHSTRAGRAMRAAADNPDAATYVGIDVDRAHRMSFGIGVAATAIAGGMLATSISFQPYVGAEFVIIMYAGVVLGGVGTILGAFWGGMVIGLVQQMSALFLDLQLQNTAIFVVFLLVLLFRPQGLFGKSAERTEMQRITPRTLATLLGLLIAYAIAASLVRNSYYQLQLTLIPLWACYALAWNLLSGNSGLISFGHASFFGCGAYLVVLLAVKFGISPWVSIPLALPMGAVLGLLIGYPTFRLRGYYFALAMLAYPLALQNIFEWLGYQEISMPISRDAPAAHMQFSDPRIYTAISLGLLLIVVLVALKVERSRFGMSLFAIKQNEPAAEAAGIDTLRWKLRAIVVSGAISCVAGGFYAVVLLVVTPPSVFGAAVSAQALILTMFGGIGTIWGPLIGAITLIPLSEFFRAELAEKLPGIQGVVYGVAITLIVLLAPDGVFWRVRDRFFRAGPADVATPPEHAISVLHGERPPLGDVVMRVENLSRSFGGLRAVDEVSFDVHSAEILGIIGPNGAGKTTLFNLLNGFLPPNQGSVNYEGHDLIGLKPNQVCRLGIARTFQVVRPFLRMTVRQNVIIGAFVAADNDTEAEVMADEALHRVGLANKADALAQGLTNKELRLLELARALASRPKLLLMDETFAGLGREEVEDMLETIRGLPAGGTTVVIIEHTMHAMVRLADRFVVLDHGRVIAIGLPDEVTKNPDVIEAYLGKKWMALGAEN